MILLATALLSLAQAPSTPPPPGPQRPLLSASVRLEDWALLRSAAASVLGWRIGIPASAFPQATFSDAAAKVDALGLAFIAGSGSQQFSAEIPKKLDDKLAPGELEAVRDRLRALNMRMPVYFADTLSREVFTFAKSLGVDTIVSNVESASLPEVDKLAGEFGISVGVAVDSLEKAAPVKGRPLVVRVRDQAGMAKLVQELSNSGLKPAMILVEAPTAASLEALDRALQPAMAQRVNDLSRSAAIRGPDRLPPDERQKVEAALPQSAPAKPKKPRKLLVLDFNVAYGGHRSIPHANLALELMGKKTGAYEAVFSNDLDNLKYDKIKQFDAVYLNNTVGMIFVDPEVREGLTRFVREGGGLAGNHGVSHASMDWAEFGEMIGTKWGVHREATEQATLRIDDPNHPLTAPFAGKQFAYQDEYFRFPIGPYSRDKLRVLLSIDVEKTDMNQGRPCPKPCVRPDNDYAVSWIRSYGKGRVFFCILGHNPTLYMTPHLAEYFLRGIQFILGDLEADTTPSSKLTGKRVSR